MQFITSRQVIEGMCVAQNILDDHGRVLIMRGQRLGRHHIVRLRKFGISGIFIDPNNGESVEPPSKSEVREMCEKVLGDSCKALTREFAEKKVPLDTRSINACVDHLVEALMKSKNPLITLLDIDTGSDRLMQHSVNTAILATVIAIDLRIPPEMIKQLAVGMLFHDVGTIFFPDELMHKQTPPTQEEMVQIKRHAQLGFDHLVTSDAIPQTSANIVFRHHEALDGTGYPEGVGGDCLSPIIRIAAVVEAYDSLTTPRYGVPAVLPDAALTYIIGNVNRLFAREVVLSLCKRVAIYPKGIAVRLNTGECGIVAGVLPTAPTRPIVLIHLDRRGKKFATPMIVDLSKEPGYAILRSGSTLDAVAHSKEPVTPPAPVNPVYASLG